jgi:hypothetical protein
LSREIKSIVDLKRGSETVYPSSEIVLAYRKARMDLEYPEEESWLTKRPPDAANVCRIVNHVYVDGICAECGSPEPPRR